MAKIRKDLIGSVLVDNPAGGDPIVLVAGDRVPEGVVLGDHVLAKKDTGGGSQDASTGAGGTDGAGTPESAAGNPTQPPAEGSLAVPPLNGAGSSKDAWRDYAGKAAEKAGLQIDIPADAKRDDIVEALRSAGIPVE